MSTPGTSTIPKENLIPEFKMSSMAKPFGFILLALTIILFILVSLSFFCTNILRKYHDCFAEVLVVEAILFFHTIDIIHHYNQCLHDNLGVSAEEDRVIRLNG